MLQNLTIYLLITIGCSCLWSLSEFFLPLRTLIAKHFPIFLKKMLLCMECSSFWIGMLIGFIFPPLNNYFIVSTNLINNIIISIIGGIITHLFIKILNKHQIF